MERRCLDYLVCRSFSRFFSSILCINGFLYFNLLAAVVARDNFDLDGLEEGTVLFRTTILRFLGAGVGFGDEVQFSD